MKRLGGVALVIGIGVALSMMVARTGAKRIEAPRFWNDRDLADWAAPIVGVDVRPGHYSEQEYYEAPEFELIRTYPVYPPDKQPPQYWETLQRKKPERIIEPGARTEAEWIAAGKRVFTELDMPVYRNYDPRAAAIFRSREQFVQRGGLALQQFAMRGMRWAPTAKGLALATQDCAVCHARIMQDGSMLDGAPLNPPPISNGFDGVMFSAEQ